jgi:uncharacterized protein (TIGR04255 family)
MFPDSGRVQFRQNPLQEVIVQLRFPRLLEIEAALPSGFQKQLAPEYPILETRNTAVFSLRSGEEMPAPEQVRIEYDFYDSERKSKIVLSSNFLAVSTTNYLSWSTFATHLRRGIEALLNEYEPAFFTRLGLRYVNVIDRRPLGLLNEDWTSLLRASIIGPLADSDLGPKATQFNLAAQFEDGANKVVLRTSLAINDDTKDKCFVIDTDVFTEEQTPTRVEDALQRTELFNGHAGRAFRWCIEPPLVQALDPE